MTEMELLRLLSDVRGDYIRQADAFREGRLRFAQKKHAAGIALKALSMAAMLVLILGAGYLGLRNQAAPKSGEATSELETAAAQSDSIAEQDAADWKRVILQNGMRFRDFDSGESYTISEFGETIARLLDVEEVPKLVRHAALDMDGDGQEELVAEFKRTGDSFRLVLGWFDGQVCGSCYWMRRMDQIKEDGSFYDSGENPGWFRLRRNGSGWTEEPVEGDCSENPDVSWKNWVSLGTAEITDSAAELPMRDNDGTLTVWQEGEERSIPARLFIGQNYSMYMPEEHWLYDYSADYHGISADRWICADETVEAFGLNTTLQFTSQDAMRRYYDREHPNRITILYRPGLEDAAIRDWVRQANPEEDFTENGDGSLSSDTMRVLFTRVGSGTFVCVQEFLSDTDENTRSTMAAMWESFEPWPDSYFPYVQTFGSSEKAAD